MSAPSIVIKAFGENAWLATVSGMETVAAALYVNAAADRLRRKPGVLDCVAGIDSVVLRFNPPRLRAAEAKALLAKTLFETPAAAQTAAKSIDIPVLYGGEAGPDLADLCKRLSLTPEQLIDLHSAQTYRVLTIGFAPGFAYLGPLPEALAAPRLTSPRPHVPAGSVGIAGAMTGVYPLASPGGWRIIGRTPKKLFDARAPESFLFTPGVEVCFLPIDAKTFAAMERGEA
jgi:KipI family sensor histidine kinase inhibitor